MQTSSDRRKLLILFAVVALAAVAAIVVWRGEQLASTSAVGNGWEPAIAADPLSPYVYLGWMQFAGNKSSIAIRVSSDNGATWGAPKSICATCGSQSQYDIVLATSTTGTVFATYMQQNRISFSKSTDHGATWSVPVTVSGGTWADKPWIAASSDGSNVYITWTTRGNLFAVKSTNGGATFSAPTQLTNESGIYYYSNGGTVLPDGTAVMAASEYPESGNSTKIAGRINITVFHSAETGTGWTRTVLPDVVYTGASFATSSVTTVASDKSGNLLLVYSGSTTAGANGKVWIRTSSDSGATWSAASEMTTSAGGADATSVAAAGSSTNTGVFTITWMDARGGTWNVWQRSSTDGGATWSADAKVSDATAGAAYKTASGFGFPYGDYDMVTINSAGKTVAAMGEGNTTQTSGDIWVNSQQ